MKNGKNKKTKRRRHDRAWNKKSYTTQHTRRCTVRGGFNSLWMQCVGSERVLRDTERDSKEQQQKGTRKQGGKRQRIDELMRDQQIKYRWNDTTASDEWERMRENERMKRSSDDELICHTHNNARGTKEREVREKKKKWKKRKKATQYTLKEEENRQTQHKEREKRETEFFKPWNQWVRRVGVRGRVGVGGLTERKRDREV